jgi:predicted NUDIX family NTP pyrophosphohydrolase
MRLDLGGREFTAWGVQNELTAAESYFVRLNETPESLVFGAFPDADDASVFTVDLA